MALQKELATEAPIKIQILGGGCAKCQKLAEHARQHVLLCLIPAFFIAGAIMIFLNQQAEIRYFGPSAKKLVSYSVALVSGSILAVVLTAKVLGLRLGVARALGAGMGQGPSLSLLLAGPSLSLPSILVIGGELGWKKTVTYVILVVAMSTLAGLLYRLIP